MTTNQPLTPVVASSLLKAKAGRREDLIKLLTQLAVQIHAEPGCTHYSVHRPLGDEADGPLLVVQAFASVEAFREHGARIRARIPELLALMETAMAPPALFEPVALGGPEGKETFGG